MARKKCRARLAAKQCPQCPFSDTGIKISVQGMADIQTYLLNGTNHLCHSDASNRTICQGGRQWQLEMWHKLGIIEEPTNEALHAAMRARGVEPREGV